MEIREQDKKWFCKKYKYVFGAQQFVIQRYFKI